MFQKLSINKKLFILGTTALLLFIALYAVYAKSYRAELESLVYDRMVKARQSTERLQERDSVMLSATLRAVARDRGFLKPFLAGDREGLYEYGRPLFENLKEDFGISHFYFHLPDGTNFLRFHSPDFHGDAVERATFERALKSGKLESGIETGKTAFALRVVAPYYDGERLIGYVELAEEINHFLDILKEGTGDDYALVIDKESLKEEWWAFFRDREGRDSDWAVMKGHVLVASTISGATARKCFNETTVHKARVGKKTFNTFIDTKNGFACGGFTIAEELKSGAHMGEVLSLMDISEEVALVRSSRNALFLALGASFAFIVLGLWYIRSSIAVPIHRLVEAAARMARGDFSEKVPEGAGDELDILARATNKMASELQRFYGEMDMLVSEKTREAVGANRSLTKVNAELAEAYKSLEAQATILKQANMELKGIDRMKSEFLQTISHELRSPLTPILGYLELMRDGDLGTLDERQLTAVREMFICGKNLHAVLDDLLEAATLQAGRLFLDHKKLDLSKVLHESAEEVSSYAEDKEITFEFKDNSQPLLITGDEEKLHIVFMHLFRNAIKFNRDKGNVVIRTAHVKDGVEVTITDTGIGIPHERLKNIFEGFFQIDSSEARRYEGVGLGLYLVKKIVRSHNGKVHVKSETDKGTEFTIYLPSTQEGNPSA